MQMKGEHHMMIKVEIGGKHLYVYNIDCPIPLGLRKKAWKDTPLEPSERAWLDFRLVASELWEKRFLMF